MKILVTGKGSSGSWQIRGQQLGHAMGIDIQRGSPRPDGHDVAILVKRPTPELLLALRGTPIIWDIVDAWPQPEGNLWHREQAMRWLREAMDLIKPVAVVAPTRAMQADLTEFALPTLVLPHHARPGQELNPIREKIHTVGYEGGARYLGRWQGLLEAYCRQRGWRFLVNPQVLADLDVVVALREVSGYPIRRWKSNVKLANAQGTGTPCILNMESGYLETQSGAEVWLDDEARLASAFDILEEYPTRAITSRILQTAAPHLNTLAARYLEWIHDLPLKS